MTHFGLDRLIIELLFGRSVEFLHGDRTSSFIFLFTGLFTFFFCVCGGGEALNDCVACGMPVGGCGEES